MGFSSSTLHQSTEGLFLIFCFPPFLWFSWTPCLLQSSSFLSAFSLLCVLICSFWLLSLDLVLASQRLCFRWVREGVGGRLWQGHPLLSSSTRLTASCLWLRGGMCCFAHIQECCVFIRHCNNRWRQLVQTLEGTAFLSQSFAWNRQIRSDSLLLAIFPAYSHNSRRCSEYCLLSTDCTWEGGNCTSGSFV